METIRLAEIPVEVLWDYTESKRDDMTAASTVIGTVNTSEVYELPGYTTPQLSIVGTNALLTGDNNLIKKALQSGCKYVRVNVSVFLGDGKNLFFNGMLNRFRPINNDLAFQLKKIFL